MNTTIFSTAPLSAFVYREAAVRGNARMLTDTQIGKKFNVNFFDLHEMGSAEFLGFGIASFPESELMGDIQFYGQERRFSKWCVFKNSKATILVNPFHCDAHPL